MENGKPGKPLLRNARSTTEAPKEPKGKDERLGMVERRLNFRDRLLIFVSVTNFFRNKKGAGLADSERIRKINEILDVESVQSYFDAVNDSLTEEMLAYKHAVELQLNRKPGDPESQKPGKKPKTSKTDQRGKEATFYLPPKVDTIIKEAIQAAQFDPSDAEYVSELCKKYQISVEE